jgi:hypothetical protein
MKKREKKYGLGFMTIVMIIGLTTASCESYLNKAPAASISDKDVYGTFKSFQGFVEEMYNCISDYNKTLGGNPPYQNFFFADEVLSNSPHTWDDGNYWNQSTFLTGSVNTGQDPMTKRTWPLSWYAIRKANLAIANINLLNDGNTQADCDTMRMMIKGQALFFRGFFHFDLMRFWGGLPYIDTLLSSSGELTLPRLTYKETAIKAAKDLDDAAALLPVFWDKTSVGKITLGNNQMRITKVHALAFEGKDLLYAASPMMNESSTGTNAYDADLCKQAAAIFAQVIQICNTTGAYKMQSWASWTDNFWVWSPSNSLRSGGTEVIMNPTVYIVGYPRWTTCRTTSPVQFSAGNNQVEVPTNNYIKNYAMANGLPIDDPASGYNPNDPWTNREPRFYKDIVTDGTQMVTSNAAGLDQFAQLYNNGRHKGGTTGSVTGYYYKKWTPVGCNPWDNKWGSFQANVPYMRLADVYLMYAEAVLQGYGTPQSTVAGSGLTAEDALNVVRNRAQLPNITAAYTASKDIFMGEIIRERAVELGFESHRYFDLRRWNISGDAKYLQKTALDFDRGANGKPINIQERVVATRVFDKKCNWLPFQVSYTKLYKDFPQNPGW